MNTFVFTKTGGDSLVASQQLTLNTGETLTSVVVSPPTPTDASGIALVLTSGLNPLLAFSITGGSTGMTYGFPITVTSNQRVFTVTVAVTCLSATFDPYKNEDPGSFQDLVGTIAAGKSALATATFQFAPDFDASGGYVLWDLLDSEGTVYSSGNAYEYKIYSSGVSSTVIAKAVVSVPSDVPAQVYQLRYTLRVGNGVAYNYENVTVHGFPDIQIGTQDSMELVGDLATLSLVTDSLYQNYVIEVYGDNSLLASMPLTNPERVSNGYFVAGTIDTSQFPVTLTPYQVVFKFWNAPAQTFRESAALWIVNPTILQAIEDVKSKVNKARQTLYGTPDSQYPSTEVMKWLRRGADAFNGAYGIFTAFTMTNAKGAVREFWCLEAEKMALEASYLCEGEKAFNFSGAAISLDVDRTAFLDNMASKIQSQLDQELKVLKQNLLIKGITTGDGSGPNGNGDFSSSSRGAMGAVGIAITPASIYSSGFAYSGVR